MTDVLDVAAARLGGRDGDRVALHAPPGVLTDRELDRKVSRRAEALREGGLEPGTVHPVVLDTTVDGIVTLLALWRTGVIPAPLNPRLTAAERDEARSALREAPPGTQAVLWTSGTTGRARGVALGREGLEAHVAAVADRLALDGSEAWLASLSLAHVGGLALVTRALLTGATMVLPRGRGTDALVGSFGEGPRGDGSASDVTHLSLVPTQLDRLLARWGSRPPPPTLRCILIGGAHAPRELVERALASGWPIALTYGMTEMWSQVATAPPPVTRERPGTVGTALPGVQLRLDQRREILVRGPTRALGYIGSTGRGATEGGTTEGNPPLTDSDGWYRTGDLGELDGEGFLRITGRASERIVSGGVNVDPVEVEDVVRAHPSVVDVAVVGVPSREWGETVAAAVVPVWEAFELPEVEAYVRERLSGPKRPRMWKMEGAVPRNVNGKVDRAAVRALFSGG
ncbi:MAG: AMP-binding protein [Gemmatimonadota bacterium]|nr:AMP-binding protein [Gemmatimonadota bacterium]